MLGLAISLTAYLIIYQETSYDLFHKNIKQIYQVMRYEKRETGSSISWEISNQSANALAQEIPDIEIVARIPSVPTPSLMINGNSLNVICIYADSNLFKVFSFKLLKGKPKNVSDAGNNIVISESIAAKYFPNLNPIGQVINIQGASDQVFTVSGIMEDIPLKSTIKFDFIIPLQNFISQQTQGKDSQNQNLFKVYVKLNSESHPSIVNNKIILISSKFDFKERNELFIFPFSKVHLFPVKYKDASEGGMISAMVGLTAWDS
jgi:hypothetical protein